MSPHREIERKFLVEELPSGWKRRKSDSIVQGYFPHATEEVEIRLRRKGARHFITIKGGYGLRRTEEEIEIRRPQFGALWPLTRAARIAKRRHRIPYQGLTIEMDVYQGPHRGLITAEIEFSSVHASREFRPPKWLGREITGNRRFANAELARRQGLPSGFARAH